MSFWGAIVLTLGFIVGMDTLGQKIKNGMIEAAKIKMGKTEDTEKV